MENTFIICIDFVEGGDKNALKEAIKSYGTWAQVTEYTYAIKTDKKTSEVRDHLGQYLGKGGRMIVVQSANIGSWRNVICSNDWLKKNL